LSYRIDYTKKTRKYFEIIDKLSVHVLNFVDKDLIMRMITLRVFNPKEYPWAEDRWAFWETGMPPFGKE